MPKIVDHDDYRAMMLDRCLKLFSRKGYAAVTMREIAKEVGVSTGTLYHYFSSKEHILEQLFRHAQETNVGEYARRMDTAGDAHERLATLGDFWEKSFEFYQDLMLVAVDMLRSGPRDGSRRVFQDFSDYYTRAMVERLGISERFARGIVIYFMGLCAHSLLTPQSIDAAGQIRFVRDVVGVMQGVGDGGNDAARDRLVSFAREMMEGGAPVGGVARKETGGKTK